LLDASAQAAMIADLREVMRLAPPFSPDTPYGKPMSVRMTSAGEYGWYSDATGYRYEPRHPSGVEWPPIPESALKVWQQVAGVARAPESCLINFYGEGAKMGMHRDVDEADMRWPVVSVSLGDDGLFRMGGEQRKGETDTLWLNSGDVVVIGGAARAAYHGLDRIRFGSCGLLPRGGRVNVTLRMVT
jgi:alkylated DNA repair protein (DNA oxidative demethylase)